MANSVVHFEIFATNVERARAFYERAFGWRFEAGGPPDFYLLETGTEIAPAAPGGINAFRCTISVRSIKDAMSAVEAAGGKLRSAIVDIPHVGKVVEIADTEDNIVCILEPSDPVAAS